MAARNDESISPMTQTPRSPSPAIDSPNPIHRLRPSGLRTELGDETFSADGVGQEPVDGRSGPAREADDYLNGGLPHESPKVAFASGTKREDDMTGQKDVNVAGTGTSTPPNRRSVQFSRTNTAQETSISPLQDSQGMGDVDTVNKDRKGPSLMSKLKALATTATLQTHTRSISAGVTSLDDGNMSTPHSPVAERSASRAPRNFEDEGSDADADAEETADENSVVDSSRSRRKRRPRRLQQNGSQTVPTTPDSRYLTPVESPVASRSRGYNIMRRRNTMPDNIDEQRGGVSEGEGRDRLGMEGAWRRGSSWIAGGRGQNYTSQDVDVMPNNRRPSQFRRLTGLGGVSDGEAQTPRRPFLASDRATTFGATRWKMLKHGLKMLGQKKEEHKIDYLKSAELMAELRAGAPAVLMLASMIQRDEHGNKRIPVLLEQLKLRVSDSRSNNDEDDETERHLIFRIELEYGSGDNRMKWVIHRSLRDFLNLHFRYKLQRSNDKYIQLRDVDSRPKQPHFPKSTFPYLRGARGLEDEDDEDDATRVEDTVGEATHSEADRPRSNKRKKSRPTFGHRRRSSAVIGDSASGGAGLAEEAAAALALSNAKKAYNERQRRKLEQYLQEMIRWLIFRADSNRLCRFLELSALGVRLAAEGGYHGKEGYMVIQASNSLDFRRVLTPTAVFRRHSPKWFLVRHSYIVCVDSPENMHIYDVYLLDSKFEIQQKRRRIKEKIKDTGTADLVSRAKATAAYPTHHRLKLHNSERKMKLLAKNERQLRQFEDSIKHMMKTSLWSKPNRFDSFAPVRTGVFAQWLVDGRDYMWNVSRAINMAHDVIYIHDWWLSPQLYMRRPAAISQKWRLDRLLQKKASQGVKVFIIIYRNVEAAVPIDSEYTKFSMLDLHPNIFVQRSPNQFKKNQFFFAHHEKICVVDHTIAFVGGIDLCFGRWDTPQHSVCDDKPTGFEPSDEPKDADHCQLWPGKDYSNPRVQDFYQLSEPYAEMYDRSKTPRMPWHDISMQVVGQPARDLTRHFVQRWNYILRGRKPTRPTPFLLPPSDFKPSEIEGLDLTGTCEVQILRSASNWSLGLEETEHSIMNAYCKMIEESEHLVYVENQFFITSCETMNVKIVNKIGDAIVERAVRAYKNNESWRCIIIIPLMPGFQNTVDAPDGTSVRLIMQCQFRSISRGEGSIFGRLRNEGIDPEDFVSFYSLRAWGKIGPRKTLVTEQLYIHAKVIIVDDKIALIGSANINERSMLGIRDSECAAIVRDTDMLWSTMAGEPYLVGRFAHTLRMRLMREHLGIDIDDIIEQERRAELDREEAEYEANMEKIYNSDSDNGSAFLDADNARLKRQREAEVDQVAHHEEQKSFNHDVDWEEDGNPNLVSDKFKVTSDKRVTGNKQHAEEVEGKGQDHWLAAEESGAARGRDSLLVDGVREVLINDTAAEGKGTIEHPQKPHIRASPPGIRSEIDEPLPHGNISLPPMPTNPRRTTEQLGLSQLSQLPALPIVDDTDIGGPPVHKDETGQLIESQNPLTAEFKPAHVDKDCMRDPLNDTFFNDTWQRVADNNTKIFRRVFRCNPDNEVTNWHEYTEFQAYAERFAQAQSGTKGQPSQEQESKGKSGPPGAGSMIPQLGAVGQGLTKASEKIASKGHGEDNNHPMGTVADWASKAEAENEARQDTSDVHDGMTDEKATIKNGPAELSSPVEAAGSIAFPSLDPGASEPVKGEAEKVNEKSNAPKMTFATPSPGKPSDNMPPLSQGSQKRRRRATTKSRKGFSASDDLISKADAELLLDMVQGSLVVFPSDWLKAEEHNSNWLYQVDQVAPLQIYD